MVLAVLALAFAFVPPGNGPFATAAAAPPDVRLMLRVRDAAALRNDAAWAAVRDAVGKVAGDRMLTVAWGALAEATDMDGGGLFDALAGRDATYFERRSDAGVEWAMVTAMDQATYDRLVERLKPAMEGGGRVGFGAQGVRAAWRDPYLAVGPAGSPALLDQVVERLSAAAPAEGATPLATLADNAEVGIARAWPAGRIELVVNSSSSGRGTTVASATLDGGAMALRHRSRFERPPIHVAPGAPADLGLLAPFAGDSLAVFAMNPWRGELDPAEPVDALLLEGKLTDEMRANMGARQVLVVGERTISEAGMRAPSLGLAFEVRDAVLAEKHWDDWARRFVESLAARAQLEAPARPSAAAGAPREARVGELMAKALGDHPLARGMDVCWVTLPTPDGAWQILATDRALLDRMMDRMTKVRRDPDPAEWHEAGRVRGAAVADHLRSWTSQASAFLPESPEAFTAGLVLAAELAGLAEQVDWRARSPESTVVEGECSVRLRAVAPAPAPTQPAPPPSAPPAPTGGTP
jgi:hypothetical protein